MISNYKDNGFSDIISLKFNESELTNLQTKIYRITKNYLVEHDDKLSINEKLTIPFVKIPEKRLWSDLMNEINSSREFKVLINSSTVLSAFKIIFKNPKIFDICTFRARLPDQERVIYDWHQDEGTWYISKNSKLENKYPATLWLSINGATKENSIQLISGSHKYKLFEHRYVEGQGFFNIKKGNRVKLNSPFTIETKPSQGIIFNSLTIHRSVIPSIHNMKPRYSCDIRYYEADELEEKQINIDKMFKIKKIFKKFF